MEPMYGLLLCSINIFALSHELSAVKELDWWERTLMYQIYPKSFKDSNGDGVGDLIGINEKLDYLKDIGVDTIWIQPIFKSPMVDMGYDVSDYRAIDPMFGTMEDYTKLVKDIHDRGMKVVLDFVPNHSSNEHEWFKLSEKRVDPYTDYYVWKDRKQINGTSITYPNNWVSIFGGSAWQWSEKREQYYYHVFTPQQPDLNYRSPKLREEMNNVLRFWMNLGTDGFRVDAAKWLFEAEHFEDEPLLPGAYYDSTNNFLSFNHSFTMGQPENFELMHEWSLTLDEFAKKDGQTRLLAVEDFGSPDYLIKYMGNSTYLNAQMPFYFQFNFVDYQANASVFDRFIQSWVSAIPEGASPNWAIESHDLSRANTRFGPDSVDSLSMMLLLLPGISCVYYGHELGMEDGLIRKDQAKDSIITFWNAKKDTLPLSLSRDPARTPMPWDETKNGGFTTMDKPWLPLNSNYWRKNVKTELKESNSHLKIFKRLVTLRKTLIIKHGLLNTYVMSQWVFMFTRSIERETIAVILNLGSETENVCAKNSETLLPDTMYVHTSSLNSGYNIGDKVRLIHSEGGTCAQLRPKAGLVLSNNINSISSSAVLSQSSALLILLTLSLNVFCSTKAD